MHIVFKLFIFLVCPLFSMGTQFLVLPFSTQELTLGSHAAISSLSSSNPALTTGFDSKPQLYFDRGVWYGDATIAQFGCNFKSNNSVKYISIQYAGIDDLEFRDERPQDNALSSFSSFGLSFDVGFSSHIREHKYGFSMSFIHFGIYTQESKGIGLNIGYAYELSNNFQLGLVMQNLGVMTSLQSKQPSLPQRLLIGFSKEIYFSKYSNTLLASIERNSLNNQYKLNFGNSVKWNRINIYTGYSIAKVVSEFSFGCGLMINRYTIGYGIRVGSQGLGIPQIVSLKILLP